MEKNVRFSIARFAMRKFVVLGLTSLRSFILFAALLTFGFSLYAEEVDRIIAKVNGQVVTRKDLDDYTKVLAYRFPEQADAVALGKVDKKEALQRLVEDTLVLDRAKKENIEVPSYAIDGQVGKIMASYPSASEFENSLIERGLTVTLLKERIKGQYLMRRVIEKYVNLYVNVSPQEVSDYYEAHKDQMVSEPRYLIWIAKADKKELIDAIAQTVKTKGIEEAHAVHEKLLVKLEAVPSELKEGIAVSIRNLKEGEQTVQAFGNLYYFMYLEKMIPASQLSLADAKEKIFETIYNKKFQKRFQEWIAELKEKAFVVIYLHELSGLKIFDVLCPQNA
ncbi:MAG: SurA N-terminal domain-containing protein [Candidatus Omnitrophota bacterium]